MTTDREDRLAGIEAQIADAEQKISEQALRYELMEFDGHDTAKAMELLKLFEAIYVELIRFRQTLVGTLPDPASLGRSAHCQSALKFDPLSASNIDPFAAICGGSGRPAKRVRVAQPGGCGGVKLRPRRGS